MNERDLLAHLIAGPLSGDALAEASGLTRAAIWKKVQALREAGVAIDAQAGRGYALAQPLQLLDATAILASIAPAQRARIASLDVAWSIDSSNSELLRRDTPAQGSAVLLAERQTGGRGRRGRAWASPLAANLYLSLSRHFGGGLARLGGLSLVAGVAAADALHALGYREARLKWPNDLLIGARKLGGILVEGGGENAGPVRAVIGLGLNVRMPAAGADNIDQPWIDLAAIDGDQIRASRNDLAAALLTQLLPAFDLFDAEGLAPFLPRYAAYDALAGNEVSVSIGDASHRGTALGIAQDGALRVGLRDGERLFHSGEVSVRALTPARAGGSAP
ncbi:bifunctional biotin--[acetyl-CoA-carboxylase] ligase/biotin operon repressor BirA [Luteimonas sp. SX5]|uniref:Bifunctional ligase/repressor BirA n=1 Tax=Luteimonas galliterrae TaxID=2940486 RepID=A0ABT0MIL3_9GAMM|nr:bifunctional biotin--[acetyl-CoA-carboxylase] ligase/biotin operon repressor BirA [Luteimonas galliterrae]MCL1634702.1 bifunctional biotin--[acetyl-CoA-carboxylase] ligase/biotin operon repressor BirA [Luteimonas galliterrae]